MNNDYNEQDWNNSPTNTDDHKFSFDLVFNGVVDWRCYLPEGWADEVHDNDPEYLADLGLRLITLYRESFVEDHGQPFENEITHRPTRAIDIKDSTMQAYFESLRNDVVQL